LSSANAGAPADEFRSSQARARSTGKEAGTRARTYYQRNAKRDSNFGVVFGDKDVPGLAMAFAAAVESGVVDTYMKEVPVKVALNGPMRQEWLQAMIKEQKKLEGNFVWELVHPKDVPPSTKILPGRWVLVIKYTNGTFEKLKARWVVRGDLQDKHKQGKYMKNQGFMKLDYYAPVANLDSFHVFFAYVACFRMEMVHVDYESAFSNSDIDTGGVYVRQPTFLQKEGRELWVCLLKKALYGLRQAPQLWHRDVLKMRYALDFVSGHCGQVSSDSALSR
jgi:hypothetical protein